MTDYGEGCYSETLEEFAPGGTAFANKYEKAMANYLMTEDEEKLEPLDTLMNSQTGLEKAVFEMLWLVADSYVNDDGSAVAAMQKRMDIAGQGIMMTFAESNFVAGDAQKQHQGQKYYFTSQEDEILSTILPIDPKVYDYNQPPDSDWVWKGPPEKGSWYRQSTREYLRVDQSNQHAPH